MHQVRAPAQESVPSAAPTACKPVQLCPAWACFLESGEVCMQEGPEVLCSAGVCVEQHGAITQRVVL